MPVKIFMPTPTSVTYSGYYRRWTRWFITDVRRIGASHVIGLLLAVAILLLQIHWGLISPNLSGHALESVLLPYLLVLAALLLLSALRAPVALDRQRATELEAKERAVADISRENSGLRSAVQEATTPKLMPYEEAQIGLTKSKLEGATPGEVGALKFLLQHGGAEDRIVRERGDDYFKGVARLMKLGLLNDERRNGVRYWFVNQEFVSALKHILFEGGAH